MGDLIGRLEAAGWSAREDGDEILVAVPTCAAGPDCEGCCAECVAVLTEIAALVAPAPAAWAMDATEPTVRVGAAVTAAEQIAARYDGDGQCWTDAAGVEIQQALRDAGAREDWRDGRGTDTVRYTLPDGSVITVAGAAWDLGYPDCYCWQGAGHSEDCEAAHA